MLPFTPSEFFAVFTKYNQAVWPLQVLFVAAAVGALVMLRRTGTMRTRLMLGLLAALWLWMGLVYHGLFFRPINPIASVFAVLFITESALLIVAAARPPFHLQPRVDLVGIVGAGLVAFALILYPLIGHAAGHRYPSNPTFGLPCPTTIFTLGVLLWARPVRVSLLIVPLLWSLIGLTAALRLGVYEDVGLLLAAVLTLVALVATKRSAAPPRDA